MKILLVDDEEDFITTLSDRLSLRGIEADCATSGKKAIDAVRVKDFDLAVIDMKMAGIGGIETIQKIREQRPHMKYIILTGHGDEEAFHKGLEAGAAFYLMKPIDIEELIDKINRALKI